MSDRIPFHPLADMFPLMEKESAEFRALVADIKVHGLNEKIVLFDGMILDGRNRYLACLEAGNPTPDCIKGDDWIDDPAAYVLSANIHRRHLILNAEQKRDLIAKVIAASPEKSDRQIGEQLKADHKTIAKIRRATGEVSPVQKRIGKDRKARKLPIRRAKTAKQPKAPLVVVGGNDVDPVAAAEKRKAEFAAMDGSADPQKLALDYAALQCRLQQLEFENTELRAKLEAASGPVLIEAKQPDWAISAGLHEVAASGLAEQALLLVSQMSVEQRRSFVAALRTDKRADPYYCQHFPGEIQKFEQSHVDTLGVDHTSLDKRDAFYQIQRTTFQGRLKQC